MVKKFTALPVQFMTCEYFYHWIFVDMENISCHKNTVIGVLSQEVARGLRRAGSIIRERQESLNSTASAVADNNDVWYLWQAEEAENQGFTEND